MDISPSPGPSTPAAALRGSRPPLDLPPLASDDDSEGPDVIPGTRLLSPKSTPYTGPRTTPYDDEEHQLLHTLGDSICEECIKWPKRPCNRCGCFVCGGKNNEHETLVCDKCEDYYHLDCLDPPLKQLPEEEWFCPKCANGSGRKIREETLHVKPAKKGGGRSRKTTGPKTTSTSSISARMKVCTMVDPHHFGPIPGVEVGQTWKFRKQCSESGIHRPPMAGISGNTRTGSQSIVISGGYKDDVDDGDTFLYSGSGGRDASETGSRIGNGQSFDQSLTKSNAALAMTMFSTLKDPEKLDANGAVADNWRNSRPVRVVRSDKMKYSKYAPAEGFRYDGIYKLFRYWPEKGKDGFIIYRYEFRRDDPSPAPWTSEGEARIKTLGLEMVYPDDWDPDARKSKGGGSTSGGGIAIGGGTLRKRKRETIGAGGKRMRACYKPPVRLSELIVADTRNAETWAKILAQSPDVIAFVESFVVEFDCPVCEDFVNNPVTTRCGHNICQECLYKSVEMYGVKCPRCWDFLCDISGPEGDPGEDGKRRREKKWKQMGGGMRNEEMVQVLRYFNSEYSGGVKVY